MDIRERIAEVVYSHEQYFIGGNPACDCEKWKGVVAGRESHADHLADMLIAELGLYEELEETVPVWVQEFNEDGSPAMRDDIVPPHQKAHIEWVAKRRLVTPWVEVGERRRNLT